MSSCNYGTSSVKADVPEMIRVTVVSDDVETQVSNKSGELDSVKWDHFARNGFVFGVKDSWLASLRERRGFDWLSSTIVDY